MIIVNFLLKYNWIFRYYLLIIFFINLIVFYFFVNKQINKKDLMSNNFDLNLKKIIKIINNPIIFDYQINQSQKIDITSDKYIKYSKYLYDIQNNKLTKSYLYYKKANKKLSYYYSDSKKNDILIKLLCINF